MTLSTLTTPPWPPSRLTGVFLPLVAGTAVPTSSRLSPTRLDTPTTRSTPPTCTSTPPSMVLSPATSTPTTPPSGPSLPPVTRLALLVTVSLPLSSPPGVLLLPPTTTPAPSPLTLLLRRTSTFLSPATVLLGFLVSTTLM